MASAKEYLTGRSDRTLARYLKEISRVELLDRRSERELARRAREEGDESARRELVEANLRFVVSLAGRYRNLGLPLPDLIDEGNLGLIAAARRFDERRGIRFITYAVWWIRQAMLCALAETSRPVRVPMNRVNDLLRIARCRTEFTRENLREPTVDEISRRTGIPSTDIGTLMAVSARGISLDRDTAPGFGPEPLESVEDMEPEHPLDSYNREAIQKLLAEEMGRLSPRQSEVLRLYFGLTDDGRSHSLAEIGRRCGLTRERIRQIKDKGINKLRRGFRSNGYEPFQN